MLLALATLTAAWSKPDLQWADGTWSGWGAQKDNGGDWTVELTVKGKRVEVRYPSLSCGGTWERKEVAVGRSTYVEHITDGADRCIDGGLVVLMSARPDVLSFVWFMPDGEPMSTAFLTRGAP